MRGLRAKQLSWLERIPDKDEVTSSILVSPTKNQFRIGL